MYTKQNVLGLAAVAMIAFGISYARAQDSGAGEENGKVCHANCGGIKLNNCTRAQMACCCPPAPWTCSCMDATCNGNSACEGPAGD